MNTHRAAATPQPHVPLPHSKGAAHARSITVWNAGAVAFVPLAVIAGVLAMRSQKDGASAPGLAAPSPAPSPAPRLAAAPAALALSQAAPNATISAPPAPALAGPSVVAAPAAPAASATPVFLDQAASPELLPMPAWTQARAAQRWAWPQRPAGFMGQSMTWHPFQLSDEGPRPQNTALLKPVMSWDPSKPAGGRAEYRVPAADELAAAQEAPRKHAAMLVTLPGQAKGQAGAVARPAPAAPARAPAQFRQIIANAANRNAPAPGQPNKPNRYAIKGQGNAPWQAAQAAPPPADPVVAISPNLQQQWIAKSHAEAMDVLRRQPGVASVSDLDPSEWSGKFDVKMKNGGDNIQTRDTILNDPVMSKEYFKVHHADTMQALQQQSGVMHVTDLSPDTLIGKFDIKMKDGTDVVETIDPLVFDLAGRGVQTGPRKALFDLMGIGSTRTQWVDDLDAGTGILVFDSTGGGQSGRNGREVFGDGTDLEGRGQSSGYINGFAALRAFVRRAVDNQVLPEQVLSRGVLEAGDLAALERAYGLKMKVGGFNQKPISLAAAGVQSIALSPETPERIPNFDGRSNLLLAQPGAVFLRRDGSTGYYMNVFLIARRGNSGL